jgi:nucleoside-diphosphate kinase
MLERTLLIIKPDAIEKNLVDEIIKRIETNGYRIVAKKKLTLTRKEAEAFYEVHREKYFFEKLINYITSGPCIPAIVEGENAVQGIRKLIGATDPKDAAEGTIRKDFAEDGTRNAVHGSDGPETAAWEIAFFFGQNKSV